MPSKTETYYKKTTSRDVTMNELMEILPWIVKKAYAKLTETAPRKIRYSQEFLDEFHKPQTKVVNSQESDEEEEPTTEEQHTSPNLLDDDTPTSTQEHTEVVSTNPTMPPPPSQTPRQNSKPQPTTPTTQNTSPTITITPATDNRKQPPVYDIEEEEEEDERKPSPQHTTTQKTILASLPATYQQFRNDIDLEANDEQMPTDIRKIMDPDNSKAFDKLYQNLPPPMANQRIC
jgi:hypothetical protein